MKTTKYLSMAAIALMGTLASCQSDDETYYRPDNAVNMHLQVGSSVTTRSNAATTDADLQKQFNAGDQVSISATGQDAVIYQLQSDGTTWRETVANQFLLWNAGSLEFQAYYPVTTGTSMTAFTLPTDQSTEANINAADYMTVTETIARPTTGTDISLELERKMARVIVTISGFNDQYDNDEKTVSNVSIYSEASGIADGNPTGSSTEIQPYAQGTGGQGSTYTALVVPGYGDSGARFITLTDGEGSTLIVKGIPELEAGNSYTFNLVVGKNTIKVQSVTVQDWTTGTTLAGGQAEEGSAATLVTAITLNKTATTISAGNTETLSVTSVTPDNATDQTVTWSSDNEAVATVNATTGEVTAVALGTANITATANDGSGVTATCAVTVNKVVTINQSDWGNSWGPFSKDGVTVTASMIDPQDGNLMGGGTFSTTLGNFTKIVVTTHDYYASGTGWSGGTWAGTPASTVSFSGDFMGLGLTQTTIVCTIAPTN